MAVLDTPAATRVLVYADEPLLRHAVRELLGDAAVAVESLTRARRLLDPGRERVLVWLADQVDVAAAVSVRALVEEDDGLGLVILARHADPRALALLAAGRPGRVTMLERSRGPAPGDLLAALEQVVEGRAMVDPRLLAAEGERGSRLTAAERSVLELLADGWRNEEIARRLDKSPKAVEKLISSLFHKLGLCPRRLPLIDRRVAAARLVLTPGEVPPWGGTSATAG